MQFKFSRLITHFFVMALGAGMLESAQDYAIPTKVAGVLDRYCFSCHDEDAAKGDVRFVFFHFLNCAIMFLKVFNC